MKNEGNGLHKSHTCSICIVLFALFSALSTILYSIFTYFNGHAILFMICAALLFAAQNQIHVQIGRAAPRHRLFWHLTAVLGCDVVWCSLFLVRYMAELVPNQIKLGLLLHITAFSLIHLAVLARYLITEYLLTKKSAVSVQPTAQQLH
ncbi:MAG: hypothetical protein KHY89_02800 [Butyricicoccus pullicaecorum]|nr:hypothetical protein [Butyricicoccus pullicaecorum]